MTGGINGILICRRTLPITNLHSYPPNSYEAWWRIYFVKELYITPVYGRKLLDFIREEYLITNPEADHETIAYDDISLEGAYENAYNLAFETYPLMAASKARIQVQDSLKKEREMKKAYEVFIEAYTKSLPQREVYEKQNKAGGAVGGLPAAGY